MDGRVLINIIADEIGLTKNWQKNRRISNLLPFPSDINKINPIQDSLSNIIYNIIIKNYLIAEKKDKKLSFYQVYTTTTNPQISFYLTKNVVDEASRLYIDTKTQVARSNLNMLQHEADSLRGRLEGTIYSSVSKSDKTFNLNPALQTQRVSIQQNQMQTQVIAAAYGEIMRNLEIAKVTVQKETPLFQIIDEDQLPLIQTVFSRKKGILIGGILFGMLAIFILAGRRWYKNVMETNN